MRDAAGIDGELIRADPIVITHGTMNDDAGQTNDLGVREHQLADNGIGQIATGIDHDHVSRRCRVEGMMHHQIVARAGLHGNGRSGQPSSGVQGPQPRTTGGDPRHDVADIGDWDRLELVHHLHGNLTLPGFDAVSDHLNAHMVIGWMSPGLTFRC